MFKITFKVLGYKIQSGNHDNLGVVEIEGNGGLRITPDLLVREHSQLQGKKIYGFNAHIEEGSDKINIFVKGFEYFTIAARGDRSEISHMKVYDCSDFFRLNRLSINRLDVERSNLLLGNSDVNELYAGIETEINFRKNKKELSDLKDLSYLDIRYSNVKDLRVFIPQDKINIQKASCGRFVLENGCTRVNYIHFWENSRLDNVSLSNFIEEFKIWNSIVLDMNFSSNVIVKKIDLRSTFVYRPYSCEYHTIEVKDLQSLGLIMDSAKLSNNNYLYSSVAYEYMEYKRKKELKGWDKIIYKILQLSCGYGYRPANTLKSSLGMLLLFGFTFWILTISNMGGIILRTPVGDQAVKGISALGFSLYLSVITFTTVGYGDVIPIGIITRILAGLEALSGLSLMAIFIFSLTKRYTSIK